ncbi:hypothetical protein G9A89_010740 [Geosiphon pyriformis]|nr:hypothetical protein G9A89_010740 [Geosiphon pyriformis]
MGNTSSKRSRFISKKSKKNNNSASPSVLSVDSRYRISGGRKFFVQENYSARILPVDEIEAERSRVQHFLIKKLFKGNFLAPVHEILKQGCKVVEIGCGSGEWVLDMARDYPQSSFIGLDIVTLFPIDNLPSNVEFIQTDLLEGLPFEENTFDLLSMSNIASCFSLRQWETYLLPELTRVLKMGGWINWTEIDFTIKNRGDAGKRMVDAMIGLLHATGVSTSYYTVIPQLLETSENWTNFGHQLRELKLGKAGGELGTQYLENFIETWQSIKKSLLEFTSQSSEEFEATLTEFRNEVEDVNANMIKIRKEVKRNPIRSIDSGSINLKLPDSSVRKSSLSEIEKSQAKIFKRIDALQNTFQKPITPMIQPSSSIQTSMKTIIKTSETPIAPIEHSYNTQPITAIAKTSANLVQTSTSQTPITQIIQLSSSIATTSQTPITPIVKPSANSIVQTSTFQTPITQIIQLSSSIATTSQTPITPIVKPTANTIVQTSTSQTPITPIIQPSSHIATTSQIPITPIVKPSANTIVQTSTSQTPITPIIQPSSHIATTSQTPIIPIVKPSANTIVQTSTSQTPITPIIQPSSHIATTSQTPIIPIVKPSANTIVQTSTSQTPITPIIQPSSHIATTSQTPIIPIVKPSANTIVQTSTSQTPITPIIQPSSHIATTSQTPITPIVKPSANTILQTSTSQTPITKIIQLSSSIATTSQTPITPIVKPSANTIVQTSTSQTPITPIIQPSYSIAATIQKPITPIVKPTANTIVQTSTSQTPITQIIQLSSSIATTSQTPITPIVKPSANTILQTSTSQTPITQIIQLSSSIATTSQTPITPISQTLITHIIQPSSSIATTTQTPSIPIVKTSSQTPITLIAKPSPNVPIAQTSSSQTPTTPITAMTKFIPPITPISESSPIAELTFQSSITPVAKPSLIGSDGIHSESFQSSGLILTPTGENSVALFKSVTLTGIPVTYTNPITSVTSISPTDQPINPTISKSIITGSYMSTSITIIRTSVDPTSITLNPFSISKENPSSKLGENQNEPVKTIVVNWGGDTGWYFKPTSYNPQTKNGLVGETSLGISRTTGNTVFILAFVGILSFVLMII